MKRGVSIVAASSFPLLRVVAGVPKRRCRREGVLTCVSRITTGELTRALRGEATEEVRIGVIACLPRKGVPTGEARGVRVMREGVREVRGEARATASM